MKHGPEFKPGLIRVSSVSIRGRSWCPHMPAFHFDLSAYGPAVAALLAPRLAELGPGSPNAALRDRLRAFDPVTDLGRPVADADMARACHAGLWLYHDFLDESHAVSQEIDTPTGSFWHAVMHRRE